jgi:hypothetical protein
MQFLPCFVCLKQFVNINYALPALIRAREIAVIQPLFYYYGNCNIWFHIHLFFSLSELCGARGNVVD